MSTIMQRNGGSPQSDQSETRNVCQEAGAGTGKAFPCPASVATLAGARMI